MQRPWKNAKKVIRKFAQNAMSMLKRVASGKQKQPIEAHDKNHHRVAAAAVMTHARIGHKWQRRVYASNS
jgi:hypothetical protein